ncbi:MAG: hypothetical protein KGD59_07285 [Candidatus Heimdallarchaeota archaeon]|nr:hypothetical protein [Candidatus Heimdallarchaeota archaeon]MBY8994337.1 hypothetical protein [Candidatus Heimdallarchaeota archaeon]
MSESDNLEDNDKKKRVFKESMLGGEGISEIDERRIKQDEKRAIKQDIDEEEREELLELIKNGTNFDANIKDVLLFLVVQFLPLLILGSAFFVPGFILLDDSYSSVPYVILGAAILMSLGSLIYLYSLIRLVSAVTYKIQITQTEIKWRNVFWWNTVENKNITGVFARYSFYFYLIRTGGLLRFGVEIIQVVSEEKEYWIRAYPLWGSKSDKLVKAVMCWSELTQSTQIEED